MRALGLEYYSIDCGETRDGRLLVFEIDSGAVVHAMDPVELFPVQTPPHAEAIFSLSWVGQTHRLGQAAESASSRAEDAGWLRMLFNGNTPFHLTQLGLSETRSSAARLPKLEEMRAAGARLSETLKHERVASNNKPQVVNQWNVGPW